MDLTTVPWQFKAGVETTWCINKKKLGKHYRKGGRDYPDHGAVAGYMQLYSNIPRRMVTRVGRDPGVVEIPTKPMTSWAEFKQIYETIRGECERFKLIPRYEDEAGGDNHIHVSGLTEGERSYLYRDMMRRPYVSWAFSHPNDDINSKTLLYWRANQNWERDYPRTKSYAVVHRVSTEEFRLFWTPNTWDEQVEQMALVQAYLGKIRKEVAAGHQALAYPNEEEARKILASYKKSFARCEREFRDFIKWIGLETPHYAKNVARMKERFVDYPNHLY
jgi:hypothetical protein